MKGVTSIILSSFSGTTLSVLISTHLCSQCMSSLKNLVNLINSITCLLFVPLKYAFPFFMPITLSKALQLWNASGLTLSDVRGSLCFTLLENLFPEFWGSYSENGNLKVRCRRMKMRNRRRYKGWNTNWGLYQCCISTPVQASMLLNEAAPSTHGSVPGCHKHFYNYVTNWFRKLKYLLIKRYCSTRSSLIQLTVSATTTMLAQGTGKFRKRRRRNLLVVWLQKKFVCSLNCSLNICQQNASCYLILMIRCSKLGLTTCSVNMQDKSNNIWLYQCFLPLLERACRVLLISTLRILSNKNYLDINYDKVRVNHPIQKGGKSFKHTNHMLVLKL